MWRYRAVAHERSEAPEWACLDTYTVDGAASASLAPHQRERRRTDRHETGEQS